MDTGHPKASAPGHGPHAASRRAPHTGPPTRVRHRFTRALVGSDPSPGELATTLACALTGTALAVGACLAADLPAAATAVTAVVAFDFFGGAVATSTAAAKRRYHAPGRTLRHHAGFVALHLQPFALALFVPGFGWWTAAALYLLALACAAAVGLTPLPLRAPVAFCATATGSAAALLFLPVPDALAWLAPVMLVKLLLGHMLPGAARATAEGGAHGTEEGRPVGAA